MVSLNKDKEKNSIIVDIKNILEVVFIWIDIVEINLIIFRIRMKSYK